MRHCVPRLARLTPAVVVLLLVTGGNPVAPALAADVVAPVRAAAAATFGAPAVAATASGSTSKATPRKRARRGPPGGVCYARNAIVVDPESGRVLFEKNSERAVPIASLTKLMTAIVFLDQHPDMDRVATVTRAELQGGGHTQLRNGERVRLEDLLHMSLMCSDNVATRVLTRESGLTRTEFLDAMNARGDKMGLSNTHYVECTGLDERNVSTAADIARVLEVAAGDPVIHRITTTRTYEFVSATRPHVIANTNRLLYGRYEVKGGKTGYINEAGYCFATWVSTDGKERIAVVLGAPTAATRFADVVRMLQRTASASIVAETP